MNKKLIAPIVTAAALFATSIGSTFALFTNKANSEIDIEAGKVQVDLIHEINWAVSQYEKGVDAFDAVAAAESTSFDALFENGNTATIISSDTESSIELDKFSPLDQIAISMKAENSSNINIKWRYYLELSGEIIPALDIKVGDEDFSTSETYSKVYGLWSEVTESSEVELFNLDVVVTFPDHGEDDNQYQEKTGAIKFGVEAVQGNASVRDEVYAVRNAEDLMEYSKLWNLGVENRPLVLAADIDLTGETWSPIGTWQNPFNGEINGNGHKIIGLSNNGKSVEEIDLETFTATTTGTYGAAYGLVGVAGAKEEGKNLLIKDIVFENLNVNLTDGNCIGAAIGYAPETADFNSTSKGGGLGAGNFSLNNVKILNVDATGTMIGKDCASSIMGKAYNPGALEITNCDTDVLVEAKEGRAGGLVGYASIPSSYNIVNNVVSGDVKASATGVDGIAIGIQIGSSHIIKDNTFEGTLYWNGEEVMTESQRSVTYSYNASGECVAVKLTQPAPNSWECPLAGIGSNVVLTGVFKDSKAVIIYGENVSIKDCTINSALTIYGNVETEDSVFAAVPTVGEKTGLTPALFTIKNGTFNAEVHTFPGSTLTILNGTFEKGIRMRWDTKGAYVSGYGIINICGGKYKPASKYIYMDADIISRSIGEINYVGGALSASQIDGYWQFIPNN